MINVSNEYRNTIMDNRSFLMKATIALADGTVLPLTDEDILQGGMSFENAVSGNSSFQIGAAIIGKHKLILSNFDGKFDDCEFTGATVVPYVGLQLSETVEYLKKGFYTVDDPGATGNIITLECLDNLHKFERPFSEVDLTFPATATSALTAICAHCGVVLNTATFTNADFIIKERPIDDAITCLDMVSYIAQIAGCYARCNVDGALELMWYDLDAFEGEDQLDGGKFDDATPYATGDNADGGNFTDYTSGDSVDGGTFIRAKKYHHFYNFGSNPTIAVDDVVITGIKVEIEIDNEKLYHLYGETGYILSIVNNPLIQSQSDAELIAATVGQKIVGMRFRPFSANILSDPSIEAGDPCIVSIRTNRGIYSYQSFVTSLSYTIGQRETVRCDAETPSRNSSIRYSAQTKAIVEERKKTQQKFTAYNLAVQQLTNLMANSFGVFKTEQVLEDGSVVYYMHNKPTLAESQTIWKMTSDAFAVSTDGGQTWNAGFDSNGNAVVNILNAIGINADWINAGTMRGIEIITNRGKIAGLNITESGLASDNDIIAITNSYDEQGNPKYGKIKVRDTIPNPSEGVVDSYTEIQGGGLHSRVGLSTTNNFARIETELNPIYGLNTVTYDENNNTVSRLSINPTLLSQKNPANFFAFLMLGGLENIMFSEDGIDISSSKKIKLSAPEVEISGYAEGTTIDNFAISELHRQISYNYAYIMNIVIKLASMGIYVDPPTN